MPDLSAQLDEHRVVTEAVGVLLPIVEEVTDRICQAFDAGGRLYAFGNGGSAADAQHLVAELIGRYDRVRRPLPAVSLSVDPSVVTCIANDYAFEEIFARQVEALAGPADVVVGFTASGKSPNVIRGLQAGQRRGAMTVLFGGADGGQAVESSDVALLVPSTKTARIQEMHGLLVHMISDGIDSWATDELGRPDRLAGRPGLDE